MTQPHVQLVSNLITDHDDHQYTRHDLMIGEVVVYESISFSDAHRWYRIINSQLAKGRKIMTTIHPNTTPPTATIIQPVPGQNSSPVAGFIEKYELAIVWAVTAMSSGIVGLFFGGLIMWLLKHAGC